MLPNDGDSVRAAQVAASTATQDTGVRVAVIPTQAQVQGLAALAVHEPGRGFDADVLEMTVEDATEFFSAIPAIYRRLQALMDVGLSYIRLGQSAPTLSGGEAQRVKLARELAKRDTGQTLYILDEPTTGLHFHDIDKLLNILHALRDKGNTIVVIEHNLDVIKTADWVIDLGPEGGKGGGMIIAEGTPEDVAEVEGSHTGEFLKPMLEQGLKDVS